MDAILLPLSGKTAKNFLRTLDKPTPPIHMTEEQQQEILDAVQRKLDDEEAKKR